MRELKRRELIRGLGTLSASALIAQVGCRTQEEPAQSHAPNRRRKANTVETNDTIPRLNVVLHGMFAVVLDSSDVMKKKVQILAPDISDHVYFAAIADVDTSSDPADVIWKDVSRISPQSVLQVMASSPGRYNAPPPDQPPKDRVQINWGLSKIKGPGLPPYCTITVPWPDEIWSMRSDSDSKLGGATYDDNHLSLLAIPTVYVLSYALAAGNMPTFDISGTATPIKQGSDQVFRLHLFAESATGGDMNYPSKAITELGKMFYDQGHNPAVKFNFKSVAPDAVDLDYPSTGHSSFKCCEERCTGELGTSCSQILTPAAPTANGGGHPRNCMAILITKP